MKYEEMKFGKLDEVVKAYDSGQCDTLTADVSQLYALRLNLAKPGDHVILPDVISKEPLAPVVRERDDDWMLIVKWTLYAMINAEELGITSKNIDEALKSKKPDVMRLVGTEGTYGEELGLTKDWAARIIRHVGNYGEVYERNVGCGSKLGIPARPQPALERRRHPVRAADPVGCRTPCIAHRTLVITRDDGRSSTPRLLDALLGLLVARSSRAMTTLATALNNSSSAPIGRRGNCCRRTIPGRPARAS